ncbi:MAG: cation diffusion facilitator family transporter [Pyrinomonadaceae bacterium]|nr:cation diffusion facilitator family transporter [Pyrinomonadaceae bacterium]
MGAGHVHRDDSRTRSKTKVLTIALILTGIYMFVEAVGGWLTNSLALLADAGHMLTDVAAIALTLSAVWFASRPPTANKTFGYYRLEILAAFVNGIALVLLSIWVIWEAVQRWRDPGEIHGPEMSAVAFGGLIINIIAAKLLHSDHSHDLNVRGAFLHVMGDLLGSLAAIVAGVLILAFGWLWADAAGSILISVIIVFGAWRLILESVNILLEGTPAHIDLRTVEAAILATEGVSGVHDLHIWTISSGIVALSAHISHFQSVPHSELLTEIRTMVNEQFGIDHLTIQMETHDNEAEAIYVCRSGIRCFEPAGSRTQNH